MFKIILIALGFVFANQAYAQTAANLADHLNALTRDKVGKNLDDPELMASISDFLKANREPCTAPEKVRYSADAMGMSVHRIVNVTCGGQPVTIKIIPGTDTVELKSATNNNINWSAVQIAKEERDKLSPQERARFRDMEREDELRKEKYDRQDSTSAERHRREVEVEKLRQTKTYNYNIQKRDYLSR